MGNLWRDAVFRQFLRSGPHVLFVDMLVRAVAARLETENESNHHVASNTRLMDEVLQVISLVFIIHLE